MNDLQEIAEQLVKESDDELSIFCHDEELYSAKVMKNGKVTVERICDHQIKMVKVNESEQPHKYTFQIDGWRNKGLKLEVSSDYLASQLKFKRLLNEHWVRPSWKTSQFDAFIGRELKKFFPSEGV